MDLKKLKKIYPIKIEQYERYIPNIEGGDIVTKMNSIVKYLNDIGRINNNVVNDWNQVMNWVMNDGLTDSTSKKVEELVMSGEFADIIETSLEDVRQETLQDVQNIKDDNVLINEQLAQIAQVSIQADIDDTNYRAGHFFDVNYLKSIQAKKYALFMRKLRTGIPVTTVHKGDSLTYGYDIYSTDTRPADTKLADDGTSHIQTRASKTYPEAFSEYMNSVYGAGMVTSINHGRSGDWASAAMTRWYRKHSADLTIVMLGTNDARYTTNCPYGGNVEEYLYWMEQLIIRELIWGKAVVLLTPPKFRLAGSLYGAEDVDTFANALFLLGEKYNIPVVDTREFHANHSYDVYSDAVHFNGEGYKILGAKAASLFIGRGVAKPKIVNQGSVLLTRTMNDNIHYINNASLSSLSTTETPDEEGDNKGIFATINDGGSIIYSFYNENDSLMVIPAFLLFAGGTIKFTIDFGIDSPQRSLDSAYLLEKTQHEELPSTISYTGVTNYNKNVMVTRNESPLIVVNKGWHTIKVEVTGAKAYFYGLELLGFQELENLKLIKKVEKNTGSIKETKLYEGSANSGAITLIGDITKFKHLLIQTGSPTDGTLMTMSCRGFNTANFRVGADWIRVPTATGWFVAQVTGTNQITIQTANDPLRYIYGLNEYIA